MLVGTAAAGAATCTAGAFIATSSLDSSPAPELFVAVDVSAVASGTALLDGALPMLVAIALAADGSDGTKANVGDAATRSGRSASDVSCWSSVAPAPACSSISWIAGSSPMAAGTGFAGTMTTGGPSPASVTDASLASPPRPVPIVALTVPGVCVGATVAVDRCAAAAWLAPSAGSGLGQVWAAFITCPQRGHGCGSD